ncbi:hypothetical protein ES708_03795 [subsurface metagenome]
MLIKNYQDIRFAMTCNSLQGCRNLMGYSIEDGNLPYI